MGKIAFVFPGQGAQHPGMGSSLYAQSPIAKEVFETVDKIRPGTSDLCFHGSAEDLAITRNTQPCLFACELAAALALRDAGVVPDMVAGFSLGEVAALTFSGAVTLEEGAAIVTRRGELMQTDAEKVEGAMAAVLKLENKAVEDLCAQFPQVYPVNYNCPGQVTIACLKDSLAPFSQAVKEAGGRALPLKVRGGFHSVFMNDAAAAFGETLKSYDLKTPAIPLYSNYTGTPYEGDFRALLSQQVKNPVRWEAIVRHMIGQGVTTFIEVGPGDVLSGLIKKIDPQVQTLRVEEFEHLDTVLKEVSHADR